jgi:hypothetical protein
VKEPLKNDWDRIVDKAYGYKYCCLSLFFQFCFISGKGEREKGNFCKLLLSPAGTGGILYKY